ncbi:MAG TPA: class I SAM-dependent methyltransferase [Candidatus Dormibacteraeota bacterium]|jgi:methyltransferase (TIGR00027 family)|nr:class I SAM-dependent methyltransferase [Candidatus Dormibacteraeota bacterium]
MQEGKFSRTAQRVAIRRAAHQVLDHPRVLDDPLALRIIGAETAEELRSNPKENHKFSRAFRAFMAARSRYAEDELARAVEHGVSQYVILGAGLDTFAYRNRHPELRVFEVDHPATQEWKREQLQAASISIPHSVTFVPVNFERQTLAEGLGGCGFDANAAAFFSWLGVTPYLTHEACMATLSFIASMPAGSGVVFDFAIDPALLNPGQREALDALSARVARYGEPFQLFFDPAKLQNELKEMGFDRTEFLQGRELNSRYFEDRKDGLMVRGGLGHLMGAWIEARSFELGKSF